MVRGWLGLKAKLLFRYFPTYREPKGELPTPPGDLLKGPPSPYMLVLGHLPKACPVRQRAEKVKDGHLPQLGSDILKPAQAMGMKSTKTALGSSSDPFVHSSVHPLIHPLIYPTTYPPTHPSICLFIKPSIYPTTYPSNYLFINPSIYPLTHPSVC